jgi:hypothetical protein
LRESDAPHEFREARVVAQRIEARVNFEQRHKVFAVFVRPVQFGKRLIFFAECRVECSYDVSRWIGKFAVFNLVSQKSFPTAFGKTLS